MSECDALHYEPLPEWTREEMESVLERNDPNELYLLPLAVGLEPPDHEWLLATCIRLTRHEDPNVRGNAILGLGYLAHTYKELPEDIVRSIIECGMSDADAWIRQRSCEAAEECSMWLKWPFANIE
jgi:hypothetical protein